MNKNSVIKILENQRVRFDFREGNIIAYPPKMNIAVEFVFCKKVGRERLLKEIIICSSMKKSELMKLSKELKTTFQVPLYNWDMTVLS